MWFRIYFICQYPLIKSSKENMSTCEAYQKLSLLMAKHMYQKWSLYLACDNRYRNDLYHPFLTITIGKNQAEFGGCTIPSSSILQIFAWIPCNCSLLVWYSHCYRLHATCINNMLDNICFVNSKFLNAKRSQFSVKMLHGINLSRSMSIFSSCNARPTSQSDLETALTCSLSPGGLYCTVKMIAENLW